MKNIESLSIVIQWDAEDNFVSITYTVTWTSERDDIQVATLIDQTSYTITGLTLNTEYTVRVTTANICDNGPEFSTRISFSTGSYHFHYVRMYI